MILYLLSLFAAAQPLSYQQQVDAALADYGRYSEADKPYIRYLSLHSVPADIKAQDVMRFVLPHLSTQQVIERIMPVQVPGTAFYRCDLRDLHWELPAWFHVMEKYPFDQSGTGNPLFVRMDWLAFQTSDAQLSSSYYDLLYSEKRFPEGKAAYSSPVKSSGFKRGRDGGLMRTTRKPTTYAAPKAKASASNFPATADEFLGFWGVDTQKNKPFQRGIVIDQGNSGVALHTRLVVNFPNALGAAWQTFDSDIGVGEEDALSKLDGGLKFKATEIIAAMKKVSLKTGESFNAQAYLLTDGAQKTVNEADVRIVVDSTSTPPVIRTPGSCVRCHSGQGILTLPKNAIRAFIEDGGVIAKYKKEDAEAFEIFYLGTLATEVKRHQDDFGLFVESVCDLTPTQVVSEYSGLLNYYDRPLTIEQAAVEVYARDKTEFINAVGLYAARRPTISIRLANLIHGKKIPRGVWEDSVFQQASSALAEWRAR